MSKIDQNCRSDRREWHRKEPPSHPKAMIEILLWDNFFTPMKQLPLRYYVVRHLSGRTLRYGEIALI